MAHKTQLPRLTRSGAAKSRTGIIHLGLGAFFRAHGAIYIKEAMEVSGGNWGVIGVSLRSPGIKDKLAPQGFAYTAVEHAQGQANTQVIEILNDIMVAPEDPEAVLAVMSDQSTKIVSLTVTEKGYCMGPSAAALDRDHPDIVHDLANPLPKSALGFIVRALEIRRRNGLRPFTVLSLDNIPANGKLVQRSVCELAREIDPELANWVHANTEFPSTMVDRIVPATTDELIKNVGEQSGYFDAAPVGHEPFRQWVVEDKFVDDERPDFGRVGVQIVRDVSEFEHMKLRMLNGAHSALAYLGGLAGYTTVSEAVSDPVISGFLQTFWQQEVIPTLHPPKGTDLNEYAQTLLVRFQNPAIEHRLEQIAMDGSQKLPQRILSPLFENVKAGRPYGSLLFILAGWIRYMAEVDDLGGKLTISDPFGEELIAAVTSAHSHGEAAKAACNVRAIFAEYDTGAVLNELTDMLQNIENLGTLKAMKKLNI